MLTKSDLSQIRKTVQDALESHPTKVDLAKELGNHPTKADLARALENHPTKADLAKELKPIKSDTAKIRKDIDAIISLFDREYVDLRKRVARIEEHLGLSTS